MRKLETVAMTTARQILTISRSTSEWRPAQTRASRFTGTRLSNTNPAEDVGGRGRARGALAVIERGDTQSSRVLAAIDSTVPDSVQSADSELMVDQLGRGCPPMSSA